MIEFNFVVLQNLAASLTLIVISANDPEHHRSRYMTTNPAEFLSLGKRLVYEEHRTHMPKNTAALFNVRSCVSYGIPQWIELSDLAAKLLAP